eukprot:CAMPEP_0175572400 /NCGR_PEP_ID=MMETSP0096-20121207/42996_1 /TAXON_ID=311494 /ORGANISM="Alexandrium monilatum, Strain CCMP3105" /LENGTH=106 /DNA_ID=CAMNT_0016875829 /DNA_START=11 /DNA_END=328 /DNA_ORIENTATION=+
MTTSLLTSMVIQSVQPVVALIVCLATFFGSLAISAVLKKPDVLMERDRLLNVFGSLLFTFFGAIASMSLLVFKCAKNPNNTTSLTVDLSVICFESEWQGVMGVGVV